MLLASIWRVRFRVYGLKYMICNFGKDGGVFGWHRSGRFDHAFFPPTDASSAAWFPFQ